ncbi:hypothetical protein [Neorhizobium tomejilense]|uniref:hypothetical protein n=1 Tax=Neorhizobium tomejilense TaxID=2093828 RepID=UPI00155DE346|nr:hypothetical protein [Neorhizobium tomejilense]
MRVAVGLFWALALSGCVSQQQDANLAASIKPASPSESSISGEQLRSCFAAAPKIQEKLKPDSVAQYSQAATYKLASLMKRSPDDIPQYASFVRGYVFPYEATSVFGTNRFNALCYFGDPGSGTRFAAMIVTDSLGSVRKTEMVGAVVEAYEKLSGKEISNLKRAALAMSIPY